MRATRPPKPTSRSATAPAGSVGDLELCPHGPRSVQHRPGGVERRAVGRVAQERLADSLAEDARPRPARRRARSSSTPCRRARGGGRVSPPWPRSSEIDMPDAVSTVIPARPGELMVGSASSRSSTSWRRPRAWPLRVPFVATSGPGSQPRRVASQAKNSTPAIAESGRWRIVTALMRAELGAPLRRVEGGGHPLAPRRRAQPGQVDHVGVLGELARAPHRRGRGRGR